MATHTWDHDRAAERVKKSLADVENVEIVEYTKDMSLENIPKNKAYRMNAVHLYVEIQNLREMLNATVDESERCHQRTLRFLNLHYRAVHRVLKECDARRVDFHNQRLHAVIAKPYDSEKDAEAKRIQRSVAIAQLLIDVLDETGDDDEQIPNARVRVGIDSGKALAVNNGRRSGREPLFLGSPANYAAKYSAGNTSGIFLTANARASIGLKKVDDAKKTALTSAEIKECQDTADLQVSKDTIVKEWRQDLADNPIGAFQFSGHTPPLKTLDIASLTPGNSRRQEVISLYADIDGFTKYVSDNIDDNPADVVRTLHVLRAEMDSVLTSDFEGRRIRFIGDCIHGLMCEGTAQTTDASASISDASLCAGGIRSSFELAMEKLEDAGYETGSLGLAIGFEFGPTATSRLGMQGSRVRCSVSRGVMASEDEQLRCNGEQTAIGPLAYKKAPDSVKKLFGEDRITSKLDYQEAAEGLASRGDKTALAAKAEAFVAAPPAVARYSNEPIRPYTAG